MIDVFYIINVIDILENKKNKDVKNVVKIIECDMKDYWIMIYFKEVE